ncbi:hypothetical protein JKP88DRAFT_225557 [Tribonema minus]|uniref:Uncharacterized protein n=1 Tax=Tribonema minus TaxID=303371 RepID=A0A836CBF1_9STRA|nr:hypothetical protein JKP88DRAFT_225557 [Tribonema minus]
MSSAACACADARCRRAPRCAVGDSVSLRSMTALVLPLPFVAAALAPCPGRMGRLTMCMNRMPLAPFCSVFLPDEASPCSSLPLKSSLCCSAGTWVFCAMASLNCASVVCSRGKCSGMRVPSSRPMITGASAAAAGFPIVCFADSCGCSLTAAVDPLYQSASALTA